MTPMPTPEEEAARLLELHGGPDGLSHSLQHVERQFEVLQSRTQLLLTLGTLALTITGFSGPKIAESGRFARGGLALGLVLVLAAMVVLLVGSLQLQWVTQVLGRPPAEALAAAIHYRNRKTALFQVELVLLLIGLTCYVAAVVAFMLKGF